MNALSLQRSYHKLLPPKSAYDILHADFILDKKNQSKGVHGAGVNIITEILHAYDHENYAVMNSLSVYQVNRVSTLKFPDSPEKLNIDGKLYQNFCDEAKKICIALGLNNFTEFDALMNYDFWN